MSSGSSVDGTAALMRSIATPRKTNRFFPDSTLVGFDLRGLTL
jgi:hypothetical protein